MIQIEIDNFDKISKMITLDNPEDQYYYVTIIKRRKDNNKYIRDKNMFGRVSKGTAFKIHSKEELFTLKDKIVDICNRNNARAYISCNPRSQTEIDELTRHGLDDDFASKMNQDKDTFNLRIRSAIDIDTSDVSVFESVEKILKQNNVNIEFSYVSPSGGFHIVVTNRYGIDNLDFLKNLLKEIKFTTLRNDVLILLYSNVRTHGY